MQPGLRVDLADLAEAASHRRPELLVDLEAQAEVASRRRSTDCQVRLNYLREG